MGKKSFVLYTESREIVEKLTIEQRGRLLTALFSHAEGTEPDDLDAMTDIVYTTIKSYIDKNSEKYVKTCEKNRNNIAQRWKQTKSDDTTVYDRIPPNTTEYDRIRPYTTEPGKKPEEEAHSERKKDSESGKRKFEKPTLEDVRQYVKAKGYTVNAEMFFDYYEANNWHDKDGRPVKSWKQKLITWSGRRQEEQKTPKGVTINEEQRAEYGKLSEVFGSGF